MNTKKKRKGRFSALLVLLVIAAAVAVNLAAGRLGSFMDRDLSETDLYNLSEDTKQYIASLDKDVNILLIGSDIDERITKFAARYAGLSDHLHLETIDPIQDPSVLEKYSLEEEGIVFECPAEGRTASARFDDIIQYDLMQYAYYGNYVETEFDADSRFTNGINAVAENTGHRIYFTEGHDEADLTQKVSREFQKKRYSAGLLNILKDGSIPEDCECIVIVDPAKDLAADELASLRDYLAGGGKVLILAGSGHDSEFLNLKALAGENGIGITDGIAGDRAQYYQNEYLVFPTLNQSGEITRYLTGQDCLLNKAPALEIMDAEGIQTEVQLSTSDRAFIENADREMQEAAQVPLAALSKNENGGVLAVFPASLIAQTTIENYANLCNLDLFMNLLAYGFSDIPEFIIPSVPLGLKYNAAPHSAVYGTVAVVLIPALILIAGTVRVVRRKRA